MNKRQVKPGDWVKVSDKETHKTYKGKYVEGVFEIILEMENGEKHVFPISKYDADFLHRDWQEVNHEGVVCRLKSPDGFVTFEVIHTIDGVYELHMYVGDTGDILLTENFDLEEVKEYAEKIIDSMKHIS